VIDAWFGCRYLAAARHLGVTLALYPEIAMRTAQRLVRLRRGAGP
jgi:hypothetical protein